MSVIQTEYNQYIINLINYISNLLLRRNYNDNDNNNNNNNCNLEKFTNQIDNDCVNENVCNKTFTENSERIEKKIDNFEVIFTSNCNLSQANNVLNSVSTSDNDNDDELLNDTNDKNILAVELRCENNRIRVALGVIIRLVVPLLNKVARGWQDFRGFQGFRLLNAVKNIGDSRAMLANLFAIAANTISLSLSSVQVVNKFHPLLKAMKLITHSREQKNLNDIPISPTEPNFQFTFPKSIEDCPEKCVQIQILAEPEPGTPIRADIVFIHGLHGSLTNTWKQGIWKQGRRVEFERPPKPPVRPPKRPRHSRTTTIYPPHLSKRARFREYELDSEDNFNRCKNSLIDEFAYFCDDPENVEFVDDVEYSFSTFSLRLEDSEYENNIESDSSQFLNQDSEQNKNKSWTPCWPDWLPEDCPGVRVIAVNYSTDPYLWRPAWIRKQGRTSLMERSREMADLLIEKGVGIGHPIVWVGHSKGGIFIKQIIVDAWESGRSASSSLWRSSRGVLFYSVPHRGSPLADFKLPLLRQSTELLEIQKNCSTILELHRRFVALYRGGQLKIRVFSFVETALTLMSVMFLRIVGVDSADPGIGEVCGVHLDHREICKPRDRNCILYTELTKMINKVS